jgi:hypothetical protein
VKTNNPAVQVPRLELYRLGVCRLRRWASHSLSCSSLQQSQPNNTTLPRTNNPTIQTTQNRKHGRPIRRVQEGHRGQPQPHPDPHQRRAPRGKKHIQEKPQHHPLHKVTNSLFSSTDLRPLQAGQRREARRRHQARHVRPQGMTDFFYFPTK